VVDSSGGSEAVFVKVSGRVQGVGFRYFTRECARRYGLAGWVRNAVDGTVELVAEGTPAALESLVHDLRQGPRAGLVESCEVCSRPFTGHFDRFEIDY